MKKVSGVYQLTNNDTGHFYIGSSTNIKMREYQMMRNIRLGQNLSKKMRDAVKTYGKNFSFKLLLQCPPDELSKRETTRIKRNIKNPLCLNVLNHGYVAGARGLIRTEEDGNTKSKYIIGKNLKTKKTPRDHEITFVSPDGKHYTTKSVARLAREHNLSQSSMNNLANGDVDQYRGWYLPGADQSTFGTRMQHLDITIVAPDGTEYPNIKNLNAFCKEHNAPYNELYAQAIGIPTYRPHVTMYTTPEGRRWYVRGMMNVYRVTDTKTGKVWENITVIPSLADMLNVPRRSFSHAISGHAKKAGRRYLVTLTHAIEE